MPDPLVTVGIPIYNARETVGAALYSVLKQTYRNLEVIVIDDGSKDGSSKVVESYPDERLRILPGKVNKGLPARLNELSALARGEYIARMDADDVMHPSRITRQVAFLQERPQVDVVGTGMFLIDEGNRIYGYAKNVAPDQTKRSVLRPGAGCLFHPTVMGKREWFVRHPYSLSYPRAEDLELWLRTCDVSNFAQITEPLLFVRHTTDSRLVAYMTGVWSRSHLTLQYRDPGRTCEALVWCLRSVLTASAFSCAAGLGMVRLLRNVRVRNVANDACVAEGRETLASILAHVS